MRRDFTYQDLNLFFERFKGMPEYISMDQVKQFIQHPKPSSSFRLKGSSFRLWTILITAGSVITISTVLYFNASGSGNQHQDPAATHEESLPPSVVNPAAKADSSETFSQENTPQDPIVKTNPVVYNSETEEGTEPDHYSDIQPVQRLAQGSSDDPIDGNP